MELWENVVNTYSELADDNFAAFGTEGLIELKDDSDGVGAYIAKWEYSKPIPTGLKLGKPKA
jgi:hypothetical protein